MGFFDFNIPYTEQPTLHKPTPDQTLKKTTRLKLAVKSMELGYSGVAYNRTIRGVMSDLDSCSISLLSLSSLLPHAPSLSASVAFHRRLLGVSSSAPFRQYTRLTVCVDSVVQGSALNSANPVLKTYDLVAVRPMNQVAFEHACKISEVDIIAIDFSEKLRFRLKLPIVKAAIERGIYFEITYSSLISDVQARSQMISNAKLLIDWTQGKNIILSSAAPSVNEIRGPYDVANLSSLLGLSMERAKAAISKNCRSLITNALRKKQFYKEAIRVELIPSHGQLDSKKPWFGDWLDWDPISSGEGDLQLGDIEKLSSTPNKVSKTSKAIDFAAVVDSMPSHGFQVKGLISKQLDIDKINEIEQLAVTKEACEASQKPRSPTDTPEAENKFEDISNKEEPRSLNGFGAEVCEPMNIESVAACEAIAKVGNSTLLEEVTSLLQVEELKRCNSFKEISIKTITCEKEPQSSNGVGTEVCEANVVALGENISVGTSEMEILQSEELKGSNNFEVETGMLALEDLKTKPEMCLTSSDVPLHEDFMGREQSRDPINDTVLLSEEVQLMESYGELVGVDYSSVANNRSLEEATKEEQMQREAHTENMVEFIPENVRVKQRKHQRTILFPFKRLLNPIPFKKKARKVRSTMKGS